MYEPRPGDVTLPPTQPIGITKLLREIADSQSEHQRPATH